VHVRKNYNNAFWDGKSCNYGDGDGIKYLPLTSLDICAHELTHGITQQTARLVYRYESGALNESFSDIFAKGIQYANDTAKFTWLIADQIVIGTAKPFRNLSNPNAFLHPKYYYGKNYYTGNADNGGVHYNSGVQNFWYFLLTKGGTGKREDNQPYIVNAIGFDKANAIAYNSLSSYLTSSSEYIDACYGSIEAARALYGETSTEAKQVERAWFAVGVLDFVSINSKKTIATQWTVLPNPGQQYIQLNNPLNFDSNEVEFADITGKQVLKTNVKSSETIDVSSLQSGLYFIRINGSVLKWVKS
jgi:Zn-dependent metalloprotease